MLPCSKPFLILAVLLTGVSPVRAAEGDLTPQQVFDKRILPIFQSPNPSSCTQCHLANVDLKNYILPSHEKTFVSLRDQGLINLDKPEDSKILKLINMREEDRKGAALILEKVRQAEYEAFAAWIKASCQDAKLRDAPKLAAKELAQPPRPPEIIRHARKDRLLDTFENTIWALRHRCMSCHTEGTPENAKYVKEHGPRVTWIKAGGAAATMDYLMASKLIDRKAPEKSLLLTKPMGLVEHKGGKKILPGDQGYKAFRAWLDDYTKVVGDQYAKATDLPKANNIEQFSSDIWLKMQNTPPAWGDKLLQVDVYAWDAEKKAWEDAPVATSDRLVFGKGRLWQHNLTLLAAKNSTRAKEWEKGKTALPPGKYQVRVYVDAAGRLAKDWKSDLGKADFVGQVDIESRWPAGYGAMTEVDPGRLRR